uniref:Uncharacterized protein n=1 Tax=Chromera velia CCMP2878 TaxID=1169474 RepID=A0A0G4FNZ9_9ALVE|eukprot:Cvel_18006.t1-p1 / transcript=Cvel_18006.t1 / gene=Cvel_18006 / organism=Chromera_velia_CCMP2878 / gene_product=hypothetical protein / transcript_product=hypothetical protein / location=Cvel_scaffold1468:11164-33885(+) / protein_length=589 / sequence_SO=supercontig / SO=protein_coding / is_pseudo=false
MRREQSRSLESSGFRHSLHADAIAQAAEARTVRRKFNLFDRRRTPFEFGCGSGENVLVVMAQFGIDAATRDVMAIHQALQATQHNMLQNIRSPFSSASSSFPASTNGPDTSVNVTETCHPEVRGNEVQKLEHLCKHQRTCTITNETDLILGLTCQLPEGIFWIEYLCIPEGTLFGSRGALRDAMLEPTLRTVWTWGRIGASCQEVCGALYLSHCSEYALALGVTTLELLHAIRLAANLNAAYFGGTSQVCAVAHAEGGLWDPASAGGRCSFTSWSGQQSEGAARCEAASAGRSRLCPCVVDVGATRPQVEFHYPDVVAGTVVDQFIIGNVSLSTYADVPESKWVGEAPSLRFVSVRFTSIQASEETRRAIGRYSKKVPWDRVEDAVLREEGDPSSFIWPMSKVCWQRSNTTYKQTRYGKKSETLKKIVKTEAILAQGKYTHLEALSHVSDDLAKMKTGDPGLFEKQQQKAVLAGLHKTEGAGGLSEAVLRCMFSVRGSMGSNREGIGAPSKGARPSRGLQRPEKRTFRCLAGEGSVLAVRRGTLEFGVTEEALECLAGEGSVLAVRRGTLEFGVTEEALECHLIVEGKA